MNKKTFGQFIAELRKEKNLTQRQLAEILNVSDKTISHWERDESSPDISLLPILADIFSISVDELLRGERKEISPPHFSTFISSQSENSMKENAENKNSQVEETVEDRFRKYRLLSLIGTGFGVFSLASVVFSGTFLMDFFGRYTALDVAKTFPLLSAIKPLVIALIASVGARIYFSHIFIPKEESDETVYIYKANRIFTLNLYLVLAVLIFGIAPLFNFVPYITLYLITALITAVLILAVDSLLKAKGFLNRPKNKKLLKMRIFTLIISVVLISAGVSVQLFVETYKPQAEELIFYDVQEFKAYMETPKDRPSDAYKIDGVEASTFPQYNQNQPEPENTPEIKIVYDSNGNEVFTFKFLNKEVCNYECYYVSSSFFKATVVTYKERLKEANWGTLQDRISVLMLIYHPVVVSGALFVYIMKGKKIKEQRRI